MLEFLIALAAFFASHVIPTRAGLRDRLIGWFGKRGYLAGYSLLSLGLLIWVIFAAWRAPFVPLWEPQAWQAAIAVALVPLGIFLVAAGLLSPNPLSVSFRTEGFDPARPGIVAITRHPVLWGFALWAGPHALANGDAVGFVLFAVLCLFAVGGFFTVDRRQKKRLGIERWQALAAPTSILPFAAPGGWRRAYTIDRYQLIALVIAIAATGYLLLAGGHAWLFGMDPLMWWR